MKKLWIALLVLGITSNNAVLAGEVKAELSYTSIKARNAQSLALRSSAFKDGSNIPLENSSYGASISPELSWSAGPSGTKSYALLLEDEHGIKDNKSIVHWIVYNIPATLTTLAADLPKDGKLARPEGALQGVTISGKTGYLGPRPRPATGIHHYHFQIYALDTTLSLPAGTTREQFVESLHGHVLSKGKLVGVYESPNE